MNEHDFEEFKDWTRMVTKGQKECSLFFQILSPGMIEDPSHDPIPVMQLGYALLLDKPIVIVARQGMTIPKNLVAVADRIIFCDQGNPESINEAQEKLTEYISIKFPKEKEP